MTTVPALMFLFIRHSNAHVHIHMPSSRVLLKEIPFKLYIFALVIVDPCVYIVQCLYSALA